MKDIQYIQLRGLLAFLFFLTGLVLLAYAIWGKL
jgi:hypothetical protein